MAMWHRSNSNYSKCFYIINMTRPYPGKLKLNISFGIINRSVVHRRNSNKCSVRFFLHRRSTSKLELQIFWQRKFQTHICIVPIYQICIVPVRQICIIQIRCSKFPNTLASSYAFSSQIESRTYWAVEHLLVSLECFCRLPFFPMRPLTQCVNPVLCKTDIGVHNCCEYDIYIQKMLSFSSKHCSALCYHGSAKEKPTSHSHDSNVHVQTIPRTYCCDANRSRSLLLCSLV